MINPNYAWALRQSCWFWTSPHKDIVENSTDIPNRFVYMFELSVALADFAGWWDACWDLPCRGEPGSTHSCQCTKITSHLMDSIPLLKRCHIKNFCLWTFISWSLSGFSNDLLSAYKVLMAHSSLTFSGLTICRMHHNISRTSPKRFSTIFFGNTAMVVCLPTSACFTACVAMSLLTSEYLGTLCRVQLLQWDQWEQSEWDRPSTLRGWLAWTMRPIQCEPSGYKFQSGRLRLTAFFLFDGCALGKLFWKSL